MGEEPASEQLPRSILYAVAVILVILLLFVITMSFVAPGFSPSGSTRNTVAVIKLEGVIDSISSSDVISLLERARMNDTVKGIVLQIDSPGGDASASEALYLEVLSVRQKKPVIADIGDMGASGAYYTAVACDAIIAKPSSMVGSIGVISTYPPDEQMDSNTLVSAPFKRGESKERWVSVFNSIYSEFTNAVETQRGSKISLDRNTAYSGAVFTGMEAVQYGLVDKVGSLSDALSEIEARTGIRDYDVDYMKNQYEFYFLFQANPTSILDRNSSVPQYYYLYVNTR